MKVAVIKTETTLGPAHVMTRTIMFTSLKKALEHFETTAISLYNYTGQDGSFNLEKLNSDHYFGTGYDSKSRYTVITITLDKVY